MRHGFPARVSCCWMSHNIVTFQKQNCTDQKQEGEKSQMRAYLSEIINPN